MLGAIVLLICGIKYYNQSRAVRSSQVLLTGVSRLQTAQNLTAALLNETVEYSKTHPAIIPTLDAIGGKSSKAAPAPAGIPATKPASK